MTPSGPRCGLCSGTGRIECGSIVDGAIWSDCDVCRGSGVLPAAYTRSLDPQNPINTFIVRVGRVLPGFGTLGVEFLATCERCGWEVEAHAYWRARATRDAYFESCSSELGRDLGEHVCGRPYEPHGKRTDWPTY